MRRQRLRGSLFRILATVFVCFALLGSWLLFDLHRGYERVLADVSYRAMQRSQIIGQSFRTEVLAADYVLRDVLGRMQEGDLAFPDPRPDHAQRMTMLLKEKADTVPDFVSMVLFNRDCVFVATATGRNTGVRSKPALCAARKAHRGPGPLVSYVSGKESASGQSVLVLTRNLMSPAGEFLGGVMSVIELRQAQHRFDAYSLGAGETVALLDDTQVLLARRPLQADAIERRVLTPVPPDIVLSPVSGANPAVQADIDGRERIFGFNRIEGLPFVVAYGFDRALALQDWKRRAIELGFGYFALLGLALLAARAHWSMRLQRDELIASRAILHELSMRDPLTGLYNRRFLDASLSRELARAERDRQPLAIIMLDIDFFKRVNDRFGHAAGDEVLRGLAELLTRGARKSDLICRYGGEEFLAVMPNMSKEHALERAESWRRQLEQMPVDHAGVKISITLSAGVAVFPEHGDTPGLLVTRADEMLYRSKQEGRNRVSVFAP